MISITHSFPSGGSSCSGTLCVEKDVIDGRTRSMLRKVEGEERIGELVRMLGGGDGEQARAMARELALSFRGRGGLRNWQKHRKSCKDV
ncbi:hypothetical protein [Rubritalea tangerina]|uniref:hypothetical protein n=1 Tax=Rubritalea tangerina TaxID=430798 RepID=UPI0036074133